MKSLTTWGQALDWYWNKQAKHKRSAKSFQINARKITEYGGKSMPLSRMGKGAWWVEFISNLRNTTNLTDSTINRVVSAGTTVLRKTGLNGLHNVDTPRFEKPKENKARLTYFTKKQVDDMAFMAVDIFDRQDLAEAIIFSAYTGLRQGELMKIKPSDVDFETNTLNVGGVPHLHTKSGEARTVPLHEKVIPILKNRLSNNYLFGDDWINKDQLYRAFTKVRDYSGHSDKHVWHSLRHSFGTFLGEVTHPRQIMAIMGHANIETSLRYTHVTDKAIRTAISAI